MRKVMKGQPGLLPQYLFSIFDPDFLFKASYDDDAYILYIFNIVCYVLFYNKLSAVLMLT